MFAICLLLSCCLANAEVYKWTDSNGKTHYGDKPSTQVKASRVEITSSPTSDNAAASTSNIAGPSDSYSVALNNCLNNGGSMDECVKRASEMQMNKLRMEREQAERAQARVRQSEAYASPPVVTGGTPGDAATARRAAELARDRKEQLNNRWR